MINYLFMDSYCTIYINDKYVINDVVCLISKFIGIEPDKFCSIKHNDFIIDFVSNTDYNPILENIFPDGFLHFKYRIEISFKDQIEISYCTHLVGRVLVYLWELGVTAIASSDYEHLLPEKGGYKSNKIPWEKNIS